MPAKPAHPPGNDQARALPYDGPTWAIAAGIPGGYRPVPKGYWQPGEVLRVTVWAGETPVPADVPGRRAAPRERYDEDDAFPEVSFIGVVLGEAKPVYCRDEDDNNPPELIGTDGWYFSATVRAATVEEAADLLEREAEADRRADLDRRLRQLLPFRRMPADAERPAADDVDLGGAVQVPFGAEARSTSRWTCDQLWVDDARGVVWTLAYNNADGDDWSMNNRPGYIATRMPLTPERAALVVELRATYELETWQQKMGLGGIGAAAVAELIAAGWTLDRASYELAAFRLTTSADVRAVLDRLDWWQEHKWLSDRHPSKLTFTPADAATLAEAGIPYFGAVERAVGISSTNRGALPTVEEIRAAEPPAIPDGPGRIVIRAHNIIAYNQVTTDASLARRWLLPQPAKWRADLLHHTPGIAPVHVGRRWSLWDDGSLAVGSWLELYPGGGAPVETAPAPASLPAAAVAALDLLVEATNRSTIGRDIWHPLREATGHTADQVDQHSTPRGAWGRDRSLIRHTFTLPHGRAPVVLWEVWTGEGGMSADGEGDYDESRTLHTDERAARAAFRA